MKNGKTIWSLDLVSELIKPAEEAGINMIMNLVNQTIVEAAISPEWELSFIVNCLREKKMLKKKETIREWN